MVNGTVQRAAVSLLVIKQRLTRSILAAHMVAAASAERGAIYFRA